MARRKLGVLVASANSTIEYEFQTLADEQVSIHSTRLPHRKLSEESVKKMRADAVAGANLLRDAEVDCIVYGITAGSFLLGPGHDSDLTEEIQSNTGLQTITVVQGVLRRLEQLGVRRFSLVTPYPEPVTQREFTFFTEAGYEVVGSAGLGFSDVADIGRLEPSSVLDVAHTSVNPAADALFVSCTNWHTLPMVRQLEERFSIPVFTSNTAAFNLAMTTARDAAS